MPSDNEASVGDARGTAERRFNREDGGLSNPEKDAEAAADDAFRQDSASKTREADSLPPNAEAATEPAALAAEEAAVTAATATEEAAAAAAEAEIKAAQAHLEERVLGAGDIGRADPSGGSHAGADVVINAHPTGNGDAPQSPPAAPSSSASARAMVPDEEDDGNQPKHITLQNYASRDSGAALLESSPASKGMANLLLDSKDKYAISPCEEKQWAVLGLSEDILVRTLVLGSHEKYSSLLKEFQVLASQTYPVHEWLDLGTFTAKFVQGEQTFEIPQPAFARYLKFKFLSHYGDEFYCTVSQVKVHGSTMLESFQHEWQQSSAEVREVQDFMKKKEPKPSSASAAATAAAAAAAKAGGRTQDSITVNDALPSQGSGTDGGGSDSAYGNNDANNTVPRTPGSTPQHSGAETAPSSDGTVEHRPHAASAATVSPGSKGGGGVGGGGAAAGAAGAGTVTVEDIVRGVPTEMVVPTTTTTCAGPTGSDGSCRGEGLADQAIEQAGGAAVGSVAPLGAEVPTMSGTGSSAAGKLDGVRDVDGGVEGRGPASGFGGDGNGGGTADVDGIHARGGGVDVEGCEGAVGRGDSGEYEGGTQMPGEQQSPHDSGGGAAGVAAGGHQLNDGAVDGPVDAAAGGAGAQGLVSAGGGKVAEEAVAAAGEGHDAQGGGGKEPPPPRKGIIHSTMEAISKVVNRGESSKPKADGAAAPVDAGEAIAAESGGDGDGTAVSIGSALEGDLKSGPSKPSDLTPPTAAAVGKAGGGGSSGGGGIDAPVGERTSLAAGGSASGQRHATGSSDSSSTASIEGVELPAAASGGSAAGGGGPSTLDGAKAAHEHGGPGYQSGASEVMSGEAAQAPETDPDESGASSGGNPASVSGTDRAGQDLHRQGGGAQQAESSSGSGAAAAAAVARENEARKPPVGSASSPQSPGESTDGQQQQAQHTADATGAAVAAEGEAGTGGTGHAAPPAEVPQTKDDGPLPSQAAASGDLQAQVQNAASVVVQEGGGSEDMKPSPPVALVDEASTAELSSAACLNALSFSEFREEVLARTQQAQQSAGGGVAIGGQYESIFKTLMNKIKTLEINQSLFGLYIDDVHGCYQDVIAKMLEEQERARASRSELLNAQTAHLAQIGDQWPAFQELQAKVVEVENRMLLSSLAWFTSLLCLVILVCSCCLKTFRRYALSGSGGGGGRRGRRRKGACDSCSPSRGASTMCPESNGAIAASTPPLKEPLQW